MVHLSNGAILKAAGVPWTFAQYGIAAKSLQCFGVHGFGDIQVAAPTLVLQQYLRYLTLS